MAQLIREYPGQHLGNEKGLVLVVSLMMVAVILLLGTTAVLMTSTDMNISANYKTGNDAFYAAEAGLEEARARLNASAAPVILITDGFPANTGWRAYIGPLTRAQGKGFDSGNGMHQRVPSIYNPTPPLDYTVRIVHATDAGGNLLYWGDANIDGINERNTVAVGTNIYRVTSYGLAANAAKTLEVEMAPLPPVTTPGALYVQSDLNIIGNAKVLGVDQCGGAGLPGVTTTLSRDTVTVSPNAEITGSEPVSGDPPASVLANGPHLNVPKMIDAWKSSANYAYNKVGATDTGMNWGTPTEGATLQNPSTCSEKNIVYYNTRNADGTPTDLKLTNSQGCGILMVDGDLEVNGGFSWYGVVLVTGMVKYTGGGGKNVTGGVISGDSMINETDESTTGGGTNIVYCSAAIRNLSSGRPLRRLSWRENQNNQ
ncbi:MAG: pilus assembly PilX family protein [Syntrophales bacterium]